MSPRPRCLSTVWPKCLALLAAGCSRPPSSFSATGLHVRRGEVAEPIAENGELKAPVFVIHRGPAREAAEHSIGNGFGTEPLRDGPQFTIQYPPTEMPAETCKDLDNWKDSLEHTCYEYASGQFCTPSGGYGPGWPSLFTFEDHGIQGVTAKQACCACGGGIRTASSKCMAACNQVQTAEELSAEMRIQENVQRLQQEAQMKINQAGMELGTPSTQTALANLSTFAAQELQASSASQRAQALDSSRESFEALTGEQGNNLTEAALHDLLVLGYTVSSNETANAVAGMGLTQLDLVGMVSNASLVSSAYRDAASAWSTALGTTRDTAQAGVALWGTSYAMLNVSWHKILESGRITNEAHSASLGPLQKVRWSKQSMRLASDLSEMADVKAQETDAKVSRAAEEAKRALSMTSTNSGILDELEGQADEVAASAQGVQEAANSLDST